MRIKEKSLEFSERLLIAFRFNTMEATYTRHVPDKRSNSIISLKKKKKQRPGSSAARGRLQAVCTVRLQDDREMETCEKKKTTIV